MQLRDCEVDVFETTKPKLYFIQLYSPESEYLRHLLSLEEHTFNNLNNECQNYNTKYNINKNIATEILESLNTLHTHIDVPMPLIVNENEIRCITSRLLMPYRGFEQITNKHIPYYNLCNMSIKYKILCIYKSYNIKGLPETWESRLL